MKKPPRNAPRIGSGDRAANIVITVIALMQLLPVYWLVTCSFKFSNIVIKWPPEWFPRQITFVNYQNLFSSSDALTWLLNSVTIAGLATLFICVFSTMSAYAFAKLRFHGRGALFILFIATLMLPKEVFVIPLFKITQYLRISGTKAGVILPNLALSFGIFLLYQHFDSIPDSLREAAKIDGAGEARIFARIFLPLAAPGMAALCILMFVQNWNDYLWQLIQLTKDSMKTIQIGVASMQNEQMPDYGLNMAGAVYAALPLVVIFLAFQKYFTQGITMGAVKG